SLSQENVLALVQEAIARLADDLAASSWHLLFPEADLREHLGAAGLQLRSGCQYQWFNGGYRDFDHFLDNFSSRKRKNLRKERARVSAAGIAFDILEGAAIDADSWRSFFRFYQSTYF